MKKFVALLFISIIILLILYPAWYGAEMLIHGVSQRSAVDIIIAVLISLAIACKLVKGAELNERKREYARQIAGEFIKHCKEGAEKGGKD